MIAKKNIPIVIGFSLPLVMILFVGLSIYLPGLFLHPTYNFLYSVNQTYSDSQTLSVSNNRLVQSPLKYPLADQNYEYHEPMLYVHDVTTNESRQVTLAEAQQLHLDPSDQSPDGYRIESGSSSDGFFPFLWYSRDYNSEFIVGHNISKKLALKTNSPIYYTSFHFLGWIE